jgi:hypothetical protein
MVRWGKAEVPKREWDKAYERNVSQTMIFDRAEISRADLELVVMSDLLGNDCRHGISLSIRTGTCQFHKESYNNIRMLSYAKYTGLNKIHSTSQRSRL